MIGCCCLFVCLLKACVRCLIVKTPHAAGPGLNLYASMLDPPIKNKATTKGLETLSRPISLHPVGLTAIPCTAPEGAGKAGEQPVGRESRWGLLPALTQRTPGSCFRRDYPGWPPIWTRSLAPNLSYFYDSHWDQLVRVTRPQKRSWYYPRPCEGSSVAP